MPVAFGPGSTVVLRLWSVSTRQGSCWFYWTQDPGGWTFVGELSAGGRDFLKELVGLLVFFSSGNFSPKIKCHHRTTVATSACGVVYIMSFQENLGKNPIIFLLLVGLCDFMFHLLALNLWGLMWWVFSVFSWWGLVTLLQQVSFCATACCTTLFLSIY